MSVAHARTARTDPCTHALMPARSSQAPSHEAHDRAPAAQFFGIIVWWMMCAVVSIEIAISVGFADACGSPVNTTLRVLYSEASRDHGADPSALWICKISERLPQDTPSPPSSPLGFSLSLHLPMLRCLLSGAWCRQCLVTLPLRLQRAEPTDCQPRGGRCGGRGDSRASGHAAVLCKLLIRAAARRSGAPSRRRGQRDGARGR